MLRGYRLYILALGLVLTGAAPPKEKQVHQEAAQQVEPSAYPTPNYSPYPDKQADSCYKAENHDTADLCAQWRAAVAAEEAAQSAWWGNIIGGIGAALSMLSVFLVIAALRQTERSLESAKRANEIAQSTANQQLRAYVVTEDHAVIGLWRGGPTTAVLKLYNRGQTPAHDVRIWSIVGGTLENPTDFKIYRKPGEAFHQSSVVIGPGSFLEHTNDCQTPLNSDAYTAIVVGPLKLIFAGVVTYRDVFGKLHRTTFKQFFSLGNGDWNAKGGDMQGCGRGNTSN